MLEMELQTGKHSLPTDSINYQMMLDSSKKRKVEELTDLIPQEFVTKKRNSLPSISITPLDPKTLLDIKSCAIDTPPIAPVVHSTASIAPSEPTPKDRFANAAMSRMTIPDGEKSSDTFPPSPFQSQASPMNWKEYESRGPVGRRWSMPQLPSHDIPISRQQLLTPPEIKKEVYNPNYKCDSYPFKRPSLNSTPESAMGNELQRIQQERRGRFSVPNINLNSHDIARQRRGATAFFPYKVGEGPVGTSTDKQIASSQK